MPDVMPPRAGEPRPRTALYNLWSDRADNWNRLRDASRRLARRPGVDTEAMLAACAAAFEALEPIERLHAFPGWRAVGQLQRLFARPFGGTVRARSGGSTPPDPSTKGG